MASTIRKMQLHTAFAMNRKHPQPSAERRAYATTIRAPANTFPSRARFSHHPCHATPCDFRPLCHQAEGRSNTTTHVVKAEESNSHNPVPRFYLSRLSAQQSILRLRGTNPPCLLFQKHMQHASTSSVRVGSAGAGAAIPAATPLLCAWLLFLLSPTRQKESIWK